MDGTINTNSNQPPRRWVKALKSTSMMLVAAIFLIIAIPMALTKYETWDVYKNDMVGFQGARIGQTKQEVEYELGVPASVSGLVIPGPANPFDKFGDVTYAVGPITDQTDPWLVYSQHIPEGKSVTDYLRWGYSKGISHFDVQFDRPSGRVVTISCQLAKPEPGACYPIFGISPETSDDAVIAKLGKPDREKLEGGGQDHGIPIVMTKTLDYDDLGLQLVFTEKHLLWVNKVEAKKPNFWWWLTHSR